jgi:Zn-dependent protease with chaperone function
VARRADPADWFEPDELAAARRVADRLARIRAARWSIATAALATVAGTGAARRLLDAAGVDAWVARLVLVVAGLEALSLLWDPLLDALADRVEGRPRHRVAAGTAAGAGASLAAGLGAGLAVGWAVRATPRWWWLAGWALAVAAGVVAGLAEPVVAGRLRGWRPGPDGTAVTPAGAVGRPGHGAAVVGIGPGRRLVVDEEVAAGPAEVLAAVLAHERAHWRHHDPLVQGAAAAVAGLAGAAVLGAVFASADLLDPAALPALLLAARVVAVAAAVPLAALSRALERRADAEAAAELGDPAPLAAATRLLATDLDPGPLRRLLSGHPPPADRLAALRR